MGSKGVVWRPIATIAAAVGDVELEDQVLRLSRYLGYSKVQLDNFYFLGGGSALKEYGVQLYGCTCSCTTYPP